MLTPRDQAKLFQVWNEEIIDLKEQVNELRTLIEELKPRKKAEPSTKSKRKEG